MGFQWKWLRIVFRAGIFLRVFFISVLLVLAFKTQMPVHIADGSSVTRTLTT
jgi:hypothetical protein